MKKLWIKLNSKYGKVSLKNKILYSLISLSITQGLFIGIIVSMLYSDVIFTSEKEHLQQLLKVVNQDIESRVQAYNSLALDIVINNEVKRNLSGDDSLTVGKAKRTINSILSSKYLSTQGIFDISIVDMKKNTYNTRAAFFLPDDFNLEKSNAFVDAKVRNGGLVWICKNDILDKYAKDSNSTRELGGIRAAAIIKDYTRNETKGLLMLTLKENYFFNISYSNQMLNGIYIYLVSNDKKTIYPVAGTSEELESEILKDINFSDSKNPMFIRGNKIVSYIKNEAMGWYLVSTINTGTIQQTFKKLIVIVTLTLLISLLGCVMLSSRLCGFLTSGLDKLARTMVLVENGNFDVQVYSKRQDEIGQLSNVFDKMIRRIKELIISKYEQELLKKEAEFKALQAQINPHFLYNFLDILNWKLLERGEEDLSKSIVSLGDLLKYSIIGSPEKITLEKEIKNVEDYLYLQFTISSRDFRYNIEVKDSEKIFLPKLTLQPLVENSVIHGFKGRKKDNLLTIKGYYSGNCYFIEVIDNGIGIPEKKINDIANKKVCDETPKKNIHIGIPNVEERIKFMHGDQSKVIIQSQYGFGTLIRIIIPIKEGVNE